MEPKLKVEYVPVSSLIPYAGNAKEHPDWQVAQIAESIKQFGNCDPIAVWHNPKGEAEIVEGHGRLMALKLLGIEKAPIISLDHLDDDARRAYTHIHNQTTLTSGFDMSVLQVELSDIDGFEWESFGFGDADYMASDGFSPEDLDDDREKDNVIVTINCGSFDQFRSIWQQLQDAVDSIGASLAVKMG